jgi:hypothetical protein
MSNQLDLRDLILEWLETQKNVFDGLKRQYSHFDKKPKISTKNQPKDWVINVGGNEINLIDFLVDFLSSKKVEKRAFWPFIKFVLKQKKFERSDGKLKRVKDKKRNIYYASHFDSLILSFYAYIIGLCYKKILDENGLQESVLAYRKIAREDDPDRGKCNLDFADEAFEYITKQNTCIAIACDITGFFDELDHCILKEKWQETLNVKDLPGDHKNIFKALTKYQYINSEMVIKYFKEKCAANYICSPKYFRRIRKEKPYIIQTISKEKGIPQGTPISGLLSNIYMLDFDRGMNKLAKKYSALYKRYSDDILIICDPKYKDDLLKELENLMASVKLEEKKSKRIERIFQYKDKKLLCLDEKNKENNFQYLGVEFNGRSSYIRQSTFARYYQKAHKMIYVILSKCKGIITTEKRKEIFKRFGYTGKGRNFSTYVRSASRFKRSKARQQFSRHELNLEKIIQKKYDAIKKNIEKRDKNQK